MSFADISRTECSRIRISRYGDSTEKRLITYIDDKTSGLVWMAKTGRKDSYQTWNRVSLSECCGWKFPENEHHEVKMISSQQTNKDMFVLYQKAGSKRYFQPKYPFYYCYPKESRLNSWSTLICRLPHQDIDKISGIDTHSSSYYNYFLDWVNIESGFDPSINSLLFLITPPNMAGRIMVS